jgi:hypothetical protein
MGEFTDCGQSLRPYLGHALVTLLDARVALYQYFRELDRQVKRAASHLI